MKKLFAAIVALAFSAPAFASEMTSAELDLLLDQYAAQVCDAGQCVIYSEEATAPGKSGSSDGSQIIFVGGSSAKTSTTKSYNGSVCTFAAKVPVPVFKAVMKRFVEQAATDSAPALDPATQTMILFYNSFMSQAKGSSC